ncbi:tetratricopeptide repeat protein [Vitellibacter sp. q18]|nr:tetratricopeptide repeat protein [Aequorivita lutea]
MKKIFLLTCIIIFSTPLLSQVREIDSLKMLLKNIHNPNERLQMLDSLNLLLYNNSRDEESLAYIREMLMLSKNQHNIHFEMNSLTYLVDYYMKLGDSINSLKYAKQAYKLNNYSENLHEYLRGCNLLGRVYDRFKNYQLAIKSYKEGIKTYTDIPGSSVIITLYNNLGQAYGRINKTELANLSHLKATQYAEKYEDYDKKAFTLYNLGWNYMTLGKYEKAEKYYLKGLKDSSKIKLIEYIYNIHHALGINYSRWGKYGQALKHNEIALNYFNRIGFKLYKFDVLNNTAIVYSRMNNLQKTIEYGEVALKIANEIENPLAITGAQQTLANAYLNLRKYTLAEDLYGKILKDTSNVNIIGRESKMVIYSDLASLYENKKDYKKALLYQKRWKRLSDSLLIESRDSKFVDIETKYQTEKKDKENLALKQQNAQQALLTEKEKTQKWAIGGGLAVSLAGLGIFFIAFNKNKKQKRKIEKQKNEIEKLQRELHHRLKNNLAFIDFFITLAKGKFPDPAYRQKLDELKNRINSMFEVHKQLFKKEDITSVNARTYISALVENVKKAYVSKTIAIRENIVETDLKVDISFPIGLIVNEFVTNSCKYAFTDTENGSIYIELDEDANNYKLKLSDNGKGLPADFDINTLTTFGMETIKLLTQEYKGTFTLDGSKGTSMDITFPKNAA